MRLPTFAPSGSATAPPMQARVLTGQRLATTLLVCAVATAAVCLLSPLVGVETAQGNRHLALLDLRELLAGANGQDSLAWQLFVLARLPRVLAGAVVGAGLAAAGCAFQALLRNPLAEPYTLGVSSGGSLAALLAIRLHLDDSPLGSSAISLAAVAGALAAVYVVWRLARVGRELPPATLLLAGVIIAVFCGAASMLVQYTATFSESYRFVRWMMGGLDWIHYGPVLKAALPTALGVTVLIVLSRDLNGLSAGADAAASVGINASRTTTLVFAAASVAVGAGIAVAGPIGFVGILVPHVLRGVTGPDHRLLMPACAVVGAGFVVACDTVARIILAPAQLPVGVVTALIGGPFFLYLIGSEKRRGRLWGG
jgi:iron complex transport system permease protein